MKKWNVYYGDTLRTTVESERAYVSEEGRLSFFNPSTHGNVAGFAAGAWTYYVEAKEGTSV